MTEDEAKTKWCPFARVGSDSNKGSGWNRPERESFGHRTNIGGENHCIASACMAWRQQTRTVSGSDYVEAGRLADEGWQVSSINRDRDEFTAIGPGFCGLAGRPE